MKARDFLGIALVVMSVSVSAAGFYGMRQSKPSPVNPATLCAVAGVSAATIVIVDKTDPLKPQEQLAIERKVEAERDALAQGAKIAISTLAQNTGKPDAHLHTLLSLCNPGSEANPLFQNPKRVLARYRDSFDRPLQDALANLNGNESAASSPIATALAAAVGQERFLDGARIKVILITDLMEHSSQGSAYDGSFSTATLRDLIPGAVLARLRDADLQIVLLPRAEHANRQAAAKNVWLHFFEETGIQHVSIAEP